MRYTVEYTKQAVKSLKKLDRQTAALIIGWIEKNLIGCENPRIHGKGLTANRSGQWRYRVGDYRILADIQAEDACLSLKSLAVNGHDLMGLGYTGPEIGKVLNQLLDAVLDERLPNDKAALLEAAKQR